MIIYNNKFLQVFLRLNKSEEIGKKRKFSDRPLSRFRHLRWKTKLDRQTKAFIRDLHHRIASTCYEDSVQKCFKL